MARYATKENTRSKPRKPVINRAGGQAYAQSDKQKLAAILLTSFVQDQFYRSSNETVNELKDLLGKVDPKFAAKAAVFARDEFGMRSISHIVGGEIPATVKGESWTKNFIDKVIVRPDDATEILAYYLSNYGKPVPNSLKKGLARGISKFDAYQLAKYRGSKHAVSLVDVLNLVHPRPTKDNRDAFEALVDDTLRSSGTFESELSKAGNAENKEEAKAKAWADLVTEGKIGQFALLRNLRNIEQDSPEVLDEALKLLTKPSRVKSSRILPFRYATAVDQVSEQKTIRALNKALDIAVDNVPNLPGKTLIAVDHSGSMGVDEQSGYGYYRADSKQPRRIANLFAAVLVKAMDADVMVFGSGAKYVTGLNTDDSTLTIKKMIDRVDCGHATDFPAVFRTANKAYDRVITVSDMQSWVTYAGPKADAAKYAKKYTNGVQPHYYNMDLSGYGSSLFPADRVYELAGFSEKVFDIMKVLEQDRHALVNKIEAVVL